MVDDYDADSIFIIAIHKNKIIGGGKLIPLVGENKNMMDFEYCTNALTDVEYIKSMKNIVFGFSEKQHGKMKYVNSASDEEVRKNREKYFKSQNVDPKNVVSAFLVHGKKIKIVARSDAGKFIQNCDGLLIAEREVVLSVTVADCLPIFYYYRNRKVVGIAHVGWIGTLIVLAGELIRTLKNNYKMSPVDL